MESKDLVVGNTYIIQKGTIVSKVQILELTDKTIYHVDVDDEKRKLRLLKEEFDKYYLIIEDLGNLFEKNFQEAMKSMQSVNKYHNIFNIDPFGGKCNSPCFCDGSCKKIVTLDKSYIRTDNQ